MQKIQNIIFYSFIAFFILALIMMSIGNKTLTYSFMALSMILIIVEQWMIEKVVKETKESEKEKAYTPPSRMEFLESTLGDDLIGKQEGYDEAVMGFDYHSMRLIYSVEKVIEILMDQQGWDYEEAQEFAYHNIVGARGEDEPIWLECSIDVEL